MVYFAEEDLISKASEQIEIPETFEEFDNNHLLLLEEFLCSSTSFKYQQSETWDPETL